MAIVARPSDSLRAVALFVARPGRARRPLEERGPAVGGVADGDVLTRVRERHPHVQHRARLVDHEDAAEPAVRAAVRGLVEDVFDWFPTADALPVDTSAVPLLELAADAAVDRAAQPVGRERAVVGLVVGLVAHGAVAAGVGHRDTGVRHGGRLVDHLEVPECAGDGAALVLLRPGPVADGLGVARVRGAGALGARPRAAVVGQRGAGPQHGEDGAARQGEGQVADEPAVGRPPIEVEPSGQAVLQVPKRPGWPRQMRRPPGGLGPEGTPPPRAGETP